MSTAPRQVLVQPSPPLRGTLRVPGDKSVSHRLAMLGALADGVSVLDGFLESEDCLHTLGAMQALGAGVRREGARITLEGTAGRLRSPAGPLDLGNSGTGLRLLAGLLAGQDVQAELTGDASLCSRPMGRIRDPLVAMGAGVELLGANGRTAPVRLRGGNLRAIEYALPVASAQVKSAVLLAGLCARGTTVVHEPQPTRDHTERVLAAMGAPVEVEGLTIRVTGAPGGLPRLRAGAWRVPGDFSSAAFWLVAAACRPGAALTVTGVGLNPRRTALLDVLVRMGASIDVAADRATGDGEPIGTVNVRGAALRGTEIGGDEIPNLIDELPIAAVAGALAEGETLIRDAAELRVKESDRIATTAAALRALGVPVEERPDGLLVRGGAALRGGRIESLGDHRIAMAGAILGLSAPEPTTIADVACVATSYPGFWQDLRALGGRATEEA